jgi:hypothetical protein
VTNRYGVVSLPRGKISVNSNSGMPLRYAELSRQP